MVTAAQMRALDAWAMNVVQIPGLVLMENAGQAIARTFISKWAKSPGTAVVVAGRGNNGGDGAVIARRLVDHGWRVRVLLCANRSQAQGDARCQFEFLDRLGIPTTEVVDMKLLKQHENEIATADLVVDALLGTGATGSLSPFFRAIVDVINRSQGFRLAVDLPSGVCADTGQVLGDAVRANLTVTCAFLKHGLLQYPGANYAGEVEVAYIGIPYQALGPAGVVDSVFHAEDAAKWLAPRRPDSHKGTHGHVLIVGGSRGKAGAALLAATGALRAGAGLVTIGTFPEMCSVLEGRLPEVMVEGLDLIGPGATPDDPNPSDRGTSPTAKSAADVMKGKAAVVVGPGLGTSSVVRDLVTVLLRSCPAPLVLDADALNVLRSDVGACAHASGGVVLLPHPGEASRLLGEQIDEIQKNRPFFAKKLAKIANAYVVLKGARTIVAAPTGELRIVLSGNPILATGGTGDVLAGIVATMIAQQGLSLDVIALAAHLHGCAADIMLKSKNDRGILASEVAAAIPTVLASIQPSAFPAHEHRN